MSVSTWLVVALALSAVRVPAVPDSLLYDRVGLMADRATELEALLEQVAGAHQVPIYVVVIHTMGDYTPSHRALSIEDFARDWFDAWGIGTAENNNGILLLVSRDDRRARIELGADWGRAWDDHCKRIMDGKIVPAFKDGDYARGIHNGAAALSEMAALGPSSEPPNPGLIDRIRENEIVSSVCASQWLPGWAAVLLIVLGIASVVASFFLPEHRKLLLIGGGLAILTGISLILLLALLGVFVKGRSGFRSGGFSSGGGFSGGGFSGGGGASGSW